MLERICKKFKGSGTGIQIHNQVTADTTVTENIIGAKVIVNYKYITTKTKFNLI